MHEVNPKGKQERGGMEFETDLDGKANFDGVPYGMLRVQVLAQGFQTYGADYDIEKDKTEITIKLKRPQGQYSVYDDHAKDPSAPPKAAAPAGSEQEAELESVAWPDAAKSFDCGACAVTRIACRWD